MFMINIEGGEMGREREGGRREGREGEGDQTT